MLYILRSEAMLARPEDMETGYEDLHSILREFERADFKAVTAEEYRHLTARWSGQDRFSWIPRGN